MRRPTASDPDRPWFFYSLGARFGFVDSSANATLREFAGTAFEILVYCRFKPSGGGWETDSNCADTTYRP